MFFTNSVVVFALTKFVIGTLQRKNITPQTLKSLLFLENLQVLEIFVSWNFNS